MGRKRIDKLGPGRRLIEKMLLDATAKDSKVSFEDKLKVMDRWMKYQLLEKNLKAGGLGGGFDLPTEEDEDDEPGES